MIKVFLTYSHDDAAHAERVHALADRLAEHADLEVVIDRDVGPGGPDEGWPAWSERQVREADRVLIASDEIYALRYEGDDGGSDRGRGTVRETRAIEQFLYNNKGRNARFRVVLFDEAHQDNIPLQLQAYHWFNARDAASYEELLGWVRGGVKDADAPQPAGPVWPEPDSDFQLPLADRRPHFDAVRNALAGRSSSRIFLFEGDGASGKTEFLNELGAYAEHLGLPWSRFDFKGAPTVEEIFETLVIDLECLPLTKKALPKTSLVPLVEDLQAIETPALLLFDTFEKTSDDARTWIETRFLPRVRSLPAVVVVVGGRKVPERERSIWKPLAEFRRLEPINNVDDWKDYVDRVHQGVIAARDLDLLMRAAGGQPASMSLLLQNLMGQDAPD